MTKAEITAEALRLFPTAGRDHEGCILPEFDRPTACVLIHALRLWQALPADQKEARWTEEDVRILTDDELGDLIEEINFSK